MVHTTNSIDQRWRYKILVVVIRAKEDSLFRIILSRQSPIVHVKMGSIDWLEMSTKSATKISNSEN